MKRTYLTTALSLVFSAGVFAQTGLNDLANTLNDRWSINAQGIEWQVKDSHQDHIEFSGEQVSGIIYYGSDNKGNLALTRKLVWPMLRTIPNDTHASLIHDFDLSISPTIRVNGKEIKTEKLIQARLDGVIRLTSELTKGIKLTRTLSPSTIKPVVIEALTFENPSKKPVTIETNKLAYQVDTAKDKGVYGSYRIQASSDASGKIQLAPGQSHTVYVNYFATKQGQNTQFDSAREIEKRQHYVASLKQNLVLETPDPVINQMFDFAKLRAAESIFRTKGGLMHAPGGSRYYAAIWANDQAEYINPFFPFLGDQRGNESALVSFQHFARFMNDEYRYIPSSIIAEGTDIWDGAGDRGDCAMIAYGASRYALAKGDPTEAKTLLPLIDWCITYSFKQQSNKGVIGSNSDELEGRFPSGDYNLSTNLLTYGGLVSASHLNDELGRKEIAADYADRAKKLRAAIEDYFGANVQGFDTYRYYEGNDKLRAWISLPFTMGIFDRKQGTLDALLSDHLWNENGIYSEAGNKTFWDRATLYAFKGIFAAQETDTAMRYFKYYSRKRLLGEHVPYAVEAWPEGNQRHLSAESALYARVITEGVFGIEPTGFRSFKLAPYLPSEWNNMCLKNIRAFANNFDVCVTRNGDKGDDFTIKVVEQNGKLHLIPWQGKSPVDVTIF